jgi:putative peptide zinc metalloprotease protein
VAAAAARLGAQERDNPQRTEVARRALAVETSALSHATELSRELEVRSMTEGIFVVPRADDVIGRFYRRGEMLGYIAAPSKSTARVLVRQDDVDLVRRWLRGAQVRMSSRMSQVFTARLVREVPAASTEFPSVALTLEGGGSQAADPTDTAVPRALSRLFQFDVELSPVAARSAAMGEHVWVRFYHGVEPLAFQWWRRIRQLFLSRFNA